MKITRGEKGYHVVEVAELTKDLRLEGWRECLTSTPPFPSTDQEGTGFFQPVYVYNEELDIFSQEWEWQQDNVLIEASIARFQRMLDDSDYIFTKRDEYTAMGKELAHDNLYYKEWSDKRDVWRAEITRLRRLLA